MQLYSRHSPQEGNDKLAQNPVGCSPSNLRNILKPFPNKSSILKTSIKGVLPSLNVTMESSFIFGRNSWNSLITPFQMCVTICRTVILQNDRVREAENGVWKNPFLPPTPTSRIHVFKKIIKRL